ncbi:3-oxoacyl-[acyl-carrier-protein] reductase FabG-like [Ostrinia nubilalis]|uniref:3-oxoacyl-[acyl-carrier-protein] reductase FabG-like n=1 Tax=Ostrinia nubilalis TaxID=29057 RepID=UPI00308227D4
MSFKSNVVIVTGASSGIGAATAVQFAKEGASLVIVGRNEARLKDIAAKCAAVGSAPLVVRADVSNDDDARRIISETIKKFGKLDVLINNAGVLEYGTILNGKILESYDKNISINLRAVIHMTMLAAPYLVKTKGNIVNVSSVLGQFHMMPMVNAYATSKAGLDHFTRGSAKELAASGVRVNAVSPGPVETNMLMTFESSEDTQEVNTPLGRVSQPAEVADLILFMASDKAKAITGSVFLADNGVILG